VGDGGRGLGSRKHLAVDSRHIYTSGAKRAMASIDTELASSTSTRIQVERTVVVRVSCFDRLHHRIWDSSRGESDSSSFAWRLRLQLFARRKDTTRTTRASSLRGEIETAGLCLVINRKVHSNGTGNYRCRIHRSLLRNSCYILFLYLVCIISI
jgi:hypothetical protein